MKIVSILVMFCLLSFSCIADEPDLIKDDSDYNLIYCSYIDTVKHYSYIVEMNLIGTVFINGVQIEDQKEARDELLECIVGNTEDNIKSNDNWPKED